MRNGKIACWRLLVVSSGFSPAVHLEAYPCLDLFKNAPELMAGAEGEW